MESISISQRFDEKSCSYVELVGTCINQIHFVMIRINSIRIGFEIIHYIDI